MQPLYASTTAPDLRKFKAAGGKLLVWHGWADAAVPPLAVVDYYQTAEKIIGGRKATQDFFRLFMIPSFGHGDNQGGIDTVDYLSYLENWVERSLAPDMMMGIHLKEQPAGTTEWNGHFPVDPADVGFTRPLYPYPTQSRYRGTGDPNNAENFIPMVGH
jgi:feruloyl esterase